MFLYHHQRDWWDDLFVLFVVDDDGDVDDGFLCVCVRWVHFKDLCFDPNILTSIKRNEQRSNICAVVVRNHAYQGSLRTGRNVTEASSRLSRLASRITAKAWEWNAQRQCHGISCVRNWWMGFAWNQRWLVYITYNTLNPATLNDIFDNHVLDYSISTAAQAALRATCERRASHRTYWH